MQTDSEGFLYPHINAQLCNNCGLCEKVCPVINQGNCQKPSKVYAAINKNEDIRLASSSGGVFSVLAQRTINKGGVVFGAAFNKEWEVEHIHVESVDELEKLRGSKYVQSNIGNSYKEAEKFLKQEREVLFSGTPCQIAALKLYLRKKYNNLTTIDVVCHGVPSPKAWSMYLEETCSMIMKNRENGGNTVASVKSGESKSCIEAINFRSKINGWKKYSFLLKLYFPTCDGKNTDVFMEDLHNNIYMRAFLNVLILRPSCYACPARNGKSNSDITLADLWGAEHICSGTDDDKGLSLVLVRNENIDLSSLEKWSIKYEDALLYNSSIEKDVTKPQRRKQFFAKMSRKGVYKATEECLHRGKLSVIVEKIMWNLKNRFFK